MTAFLVSADDLHTAGDAYVILDASVVKTSPPGAAKAYRAAWDHFAGEGHIPGARFADLLDRFSDPDGAFPFTRPSAARFTTSAQALGLSNQDRIVIYDRANGIWAARLWWLFRALGHDDVAVLDGGYAAWLRRSHAVETGLGSIAKPGSFIARECPGFFVDTAAVIDIVAGRRGARLINVLRQAVHSGRERAYARPGHIPGSINLPYEQCLDPEAGTFLPIDTLQRRFAGTLADPTTIVTYCGGGITAAGSALVLAILGRRDVAIYDGSLNAWAADPRLPLVVDP